MSKMDNMIEVLKANPDLMAAPVADVIGAYEAAHGAAVSAETVRLARKAFAPVAEAMKDQPSEPDYDAKQDVYEESLSDEDTPDEDIPAPDGGHDEREPEDPQDTENGEANASESSDQAAPGNGDEGPAAIHAAAEAPGETADNDSATSAPEGDSDAVKSEEKLITREPQDGRCNHRMERAGDLCGRPEGHPGIHTTVAQMEKKKGYSKTHAKSRYHSDPAYAARVKAASRASHKKARDAAKAAKEAQKEAETAASAPAE